MARRIRTEGDSNAVRIARVTGLKQCRPQGIAYCSFVRHDESKQMLARKKIQLPMWTPTHSSSGLHTYFVQVIHMKMLHLLALRGRSEERLLKQQHENEPKCRKLFNSV